MTDPARKDEKKQEGDRELQRCYRNALAMCVAAGVSTEPAEQLKQQLLHLQEFFEQSVRLFADRFTSGNIDRATFRAGFNRLAEDFGRDVVLAVKTTTLTVCAEALQPYGSKLDPTFLSKKGRN